MSLGNVEDIDMNDDEKQAFQYLNNRHSNLLEELRLNREEINKVQAEKEEKICAVSEKLMKAKQDEERLRYLIYSNFDLDSSVVFRDFQRGERGST